jgi:predicted hydrocarbon binding protein
VKKAGEKYFGASVRRVGASIVFGVKESVTFEAAPRAIGCLYYESALREMLKLLVNGGGMIDHVRCREKGEDICEWRADWRAVKTSH